jgi:hypothetical protein
MNKTDKKYIKAIENRGFELSFPTGWPGYSWKQAGTAELKLIEKKKGYRLYGIEGKRKYSRRVSWFVKIRYLVGCEHGQYWCNRVPSTIDTIDDAIEWLKPAEVKKAKGRVLRQGDVFIIEKTRDCNSFLPRNHDWDAETRTLKHPEHKDISVPFPCKFIQAKELINGAGRD